MFFLSVFAVFIVGVLVGCVAAGGVLVIPALENLVGLPTHAAMGTTLFSFIFTGILGAVLYARKGDMDWRIAIPLCLGSVITAYLGAQTSACLSARFLNICLSCMIIFSGLCSLRPPKKMHIFQAALASPTRTMIIVGAGVGYICGLTGAGGPILSVPIMIALGFPPLLTIAASHVLAILLSASGSVGNFMNDAINFSTALWVVPVELTGVILGVIIAHKVHAATLKKIVAVSCIGIGGYILIKSLLG